MRARAPFAMVVVLTYAASMVAASASAAELPRYKFAVGQELTYRTTDPPSERTDGEGHTTLGHSTTTWTVTVVQHNDDGSYRLVVKETYVFLRNVNDENTRTESVDGNQFDIKPDGELLERNAYTLMNLPLEMFPRLVPDAASYQCGWSDTLPFDGTARRYTSTAPYDVKNAAWRFEETTIDNLGIVHDLTSRRHFDFDPERGLISKVSTTTVRGALFGQATDLSTNGVELVDVRRLDATSLATFRSESSTFFAAAARCAQDVDQADTDVAHASEHYDRGLSALRELQGQLTAPAIRAMFDAKLSEVETARDNTLRTAAEIIKLLNTASPQWTTTDLAGNPVSLADYRGRVVLLDFWYRSCGWCIRAMPEIKQVVEDFKDQDVTVLGLNHDRIVDHAQLVVDRLKLNYRSLKDGQDDEAISKKYLVSGWPTLVILDGSGVIRHFHAGYSPTMRQQLGDVIRKLLAEASASR